MCWGLPPEAAWKSRLAHPSATYAMYALRRYRVSSAYSYVIAFRYLCSKISPPSYTAGRLHIRTLHSGMRDMLMNEQRYAAIDMCMRRYKPVATDIVRRRSMTSSSREKVRQRS